MVAQPVLPDCVLSLALVKLVGGSWRRMTQRMRDGEGWGKEMQS